MGGNEWADKFTAVIEYGKGGLLLLLLAGALANGHKEYISKNPRKFVWDSIACGGFAAIAFVIIAIIRNRPDLCIQLAMFSFLLFFFYNVVREISGFNALTDPSKLTQGENKEAKLLKWPSFIMVVLGFIVLVFLAYKAKVPHPISRGTLFTEAAVLGIATGISEYIIAKNHGESTDNQIVAGLGSVVMFGGAHLVLQWGGLYSHIFSPAPPCIY